MVREPVPQQHHIEEHPFVEGVAFFEQNFVDNPFFIFSTKDLDRITKLVKTRGIKTTAQQSMIVREYQDPHTGELVRWKVKPDIERGFPGALDQDFMVTVQNLYLQHGFMNPLPLPSWRELCRIMGKQYRYVPLLKESAKRIAATSIETNRYLVKNEDKKLFNVGNIEDKEAIFTPWAYAGAGQTLPDGTKAEFACLWLHFPFSQALESAYLKPGDYQYFMSLSPVAKRIYLLQGKKFFGLKNRDYTKEEYVSWCEQIPLAPQDYFSFAKKQLDRTAHKELLQTGFFHDVEWVQDKSEKKWHIFYTPGERALQEIKEGKLRLQQFAKARQREGGAIREAQLQQYVAEALVTINEVGNDITRNFLFKAANNLGMEVIPLAVSRLKADFLHNKSEVIKNSPGALLVADIKQLARQRGKDL